MRGSLPARSWRTVLLALGGLLVTAAVAGFATLVITLDVSGVADRALRNDIEVEDRGDDLRVAVLDLRYFHSIIDFDGASREGINDLESAYGRVIEGVDVLRDVRLGAQVPTPDEMRRLAETYWAVFRPAIDAYATDRPAFDEASTRSLELLGRLESHAQSIDRRGEELAAAAFRSVREATDRAVWTLLAVIAVLGTTGMALGYAAVRVITEMRRAYDAQQESTARLEAALTAKTQFIADASHELRTPLTVLRGNAEVGLATLGGGGHHEILREIVADAARMTRLVEDLLFLARSDTGSVALEFSLVSLEPWAAEVAARGEVLSREHGVRFAARLSAMGEARIDPGRVEQAVLGVVDNAAKVSGPGGTVALSVTVQDGSLVVEVVDDGPGIPAADLALVFERFFRLDKTRARRVGGTGLGLAIAKATIEGHGGRIVAESALGRGTTMRLTVPCVRPSTGRAGAGPRASE